MSKNITVTSVDAVDMHDKSNVQSEVPRKKMKMLHEQIFEQYGIDPQKVYERTGLLKNIPPEWLPEILLLNMNSSKIPRTYQNVNLKDRAISLGFQTQEICENFFKEFNTNMPKAINSFITSKEEDPKKYNRIIVTETSVSDLQITIRY